MNARDLRSRRCAAMAAALCIAMLTPSALRAGTFWVPLGPDLINNGQAWPGRVPVTGRINVVAPNPENPFGDVWIGSATGGVWHGSVAPDNFWEPMTDQAESLAVGTIALDNCSQSGCGTVWVGTGENSIRRDTQYGQGILKGQWNSSLNVYEWTLHGKDKFTRGNITKIVLDPTTSGSGKVLFAALSTGQTSNGSHSTVTTEPPGPLGIWRSTNGGLMWTNVLTQKTPATDLEMDPQNHKILFAGLRHKGLVRSLDGGDNWEAMGNGIPASVLATADWPEIAVFRTPDMDEALLYTALAVCPHPHDKGDAKFCSPAIYASSDGGDNWVLMHAAVTPPPVYGEPLTGYASYTHALTVHPTEPQTLWYGGINLYKSGSAGILWEKVGNDQLHPDHHQVVIIPYKKSKTGIIAYDVNDGGFFVGNGSDWWTGKYQQGLAVTQFQSVSASPPKTVGILMGGTQDNGTNVYQSTKIWKHADDGDSASTLIDRDNSSILYDVYVGAEPRRCTPDDACGSGAIGWPYITDGLPTGPDVSWYPPMAQGPKAVEGQHPLYIGVTELYQSLNDGDHWSPTGGVLPWPSGGPGTIKALNDIQNPISAIAVAPSNPDRVYIGFYGGQVFTTANGLSAAPLWTLLSTGLPGRPVTSLAVHPVDEKTVFAGIAGFGTHSVYRSTGGDPWGPLDDSVLGDLSSGSVNTLAIETTPPYAVWAGTDDGVYSREDADSLLSVWYRNKQGLPNVAVYDLEIVSGGFLYAATHGRGVWRLSLAKEKSDLFPDFYFEDCCGYIDLYDPQPFISMSLSGFEPLQRCSVSLYEGSRLCSASALDADGATLTTDGYGFLVAEKAGFYKDRPVSWACQGGACAGGVAYSRCEVSEIEVACGTRSVRSEVSRAQEVQRPASTELGFEPTGRDGSFTLTPMLKKNGGLSTPLCSVSVAYLAGDEDERVLARAADAVSSDARCQREGVRAVLSGSSSPGKQEDEGPAPFRLSLSAAAQTGVQLLTEVSAAGPAALTVDSYGVPLLGSRVVPRVEFSGRAAGGRVEVTESSPLGTCTFAVDTAAGDPAETVAAAVQQAFLGRPDPSVLDLGAGCLPRQNARDAHLSGAVLRFPLGQQVTVTSTDPGLGFTIGSDR